MFSHLKNYLFGSERGEEENTVPKSLDEVVAVEDTLTAAHLDGNSLIDEEDWVLVDDDEGDTIFVYKFDLSPTTNQHFKLMQTNVCYCVFFVSSLQMT